MFACFWIWKRCGGYPFAGGETIKRRGRVKDEEGGVGQGGVSSGVYGGNMQDRKSVV